MTSSVGLGFGCVFLDGHLTFHTSPVAFSMISRKHVWGKELVYCWVTRKFGKMTTLPTAKSSTVRNTVDVFCRQVWILVPRVLFVDFCTTGFLVVIGILLFFPICFNFLVLFVGIFIIFFGRMAAFLVVIGILLFFPICFNFLVLFVGIFIIFFGRMARCNKDDMSYMI